VPVVIVGLEKDPFGPLANRTRFYAEATGLEIYADDTEHIVLHEYFSSNRGDGSQNASDFVILNGVANSPSHAQWEVLFKQSRTPVTRNLRSAIDSVEAGLLVVAPPEPPTIESPKITQGQLEFTISAESARTYMIQTSLDLKTWSDLREINPTEDGPITLREEVMAAIAGRYFRVTAL
jgi:hypothetical protein